MRDAVSAGAPPAALAPTRGLYLSGEDHLRITTFNSAAGVALAIEGRYLDVTGRLVASGDRHVPATDRTAASTLIRLGEGWLLDVVVRATEGTPRVGQCFAVLELVRGFTGAVVPVALLAQGYVTDTMRFGWPGSPIQRSIDGRGVIRSIAGTNPAAGAEISETVPANARWRFIALAVQFVTDATAATRTSSLLFDDGATSHYVASALFTQTAGVTMTYVAGAMGYIAGANNVLGTWLTPPDLVLMGGFRIRSLTANIQAGDNWGAPQLLVEEWIED